MSEGVKVGYVTDGEKEVADKDREAGIIVAYVLFAVGAVLLVILSIWLCMYFSKKRKKRRDAQSPTVLYANSEGPKLVERHTVAFKNPLSVETNNNAVPVIVERHSGVAENVGFGSKTRPARTATLPRTAYILDDQVDPPRSAPPKMVFAVDDSTLRRAEVRKAYVLTEQKRPAHKAQSLDRGYVSRHRLRSQSSRNSDTRIVHAPVPTSRRPMQPIRVVRRPENGAEHQAVKVGGEQHVVGQSLPTLLRIQPTNIGRIRNQTHQPQPQAQHASDPRQMHYVLDDNNGNYVSSGGSHIDDWMERHHATAAHTTYSRDNVLYEDAVDASRAPEQPQRTRWSRQHDDDDEEKEEEVNEALRMRWSPSMRHTLDGKRARGDVVSSARSAPPAITRTEPDGKTQTLHLYGSVDDGLY